MNGQDTEETGEWGKWLNKLGIGEFMLRAEAEIHEIVKQARRYCPGIELPATEGIQVFECKLDFYERYVLVCLGWRQLSDSPKVSSKELSPKTHEALFGFYTKWDFHPVDGLGRSLRRVNELAPLRLDATSVVQYAKLRIVFEYGTTRSRRKRETTEFQPPKELRLCRIDSGSKASGSVVNVAPEQEMAFTAHCCQVDDEGKILEGYEVQDMFVSVGPRGEVDESSGKSCDLPRRSEKEPYHRARVLWSWRTERAAYFEEWEPLETGTRTAVTKALRESCGYWANVSGVILRQKTLSFYKNYRLLEIVDRNENQVRRAYALFKFKVIDGECRILPLNGEAGILHYINAYSPSTKEFDRRTESDLSLAVDHDNTINEYLRFFCWAVHGQSSGKTSPFSIPLDITQIPLRKAIAPEMQEELRRAQQKDLGWGISPGEATDEELQEQEIERSENLVIRKCAMTYDTSALSRWQSTSRPGW